MDCLDGLGVTKLNLGVESDRSYLGKVMMEDNNKDVSVDVVAVPDNDAVDAVEAPDDDNIDGIYMDVDLDDGDDGDLDVDFNADDCCNILYILWQNKSNAEKRGLHNACAAGSFFLCL